MAGSATLKSHQPSKVEIIGVTKVFPSRQTSQGVRALDSVDLTIRENEFFTLLGPSGCGKTTLLRTIAGFESPSSGTIRLDGQAVNHLPAHKRRVNTVFQSYALFPHLSIAKNIAFGLEMLGKSRGEIDTTVKRMLELVRLDGVAERRPAQLSGGQQQRVALARALASSPSLLLLDEPLSALDLRLRREMQGELKRIQHDTGTTFIYVTHDQEEALAMSNRIAVMDAGQVHQVATPKEIYESPYNLTVAKFIGDINLIDVKMHSIEGDTTVVVLPNGASCPVSRHTEVGLDSAVKLAVRPEHVLLSKCDDGLFNASVVDMTYTGAETVVRLHSEFAADLLVRLRSSIDGTEVAVGHSVGVRFEPDTARVLPAGAQHAG